MTNTATTKPSDMANLKTIITTRGMRPVAPSSSPRTGESGSSSANRNGDIAIRVITNDNSRLQSPAKSSRYGVTYFNDIISNASRTVA